MSAALAAMKIGDSIRVQGPFELKELRQDYEHIIMLCAGTGITPMLQLSRCHINQQRQLLAVQLVFRHCSCVTKPDASMRFLTAVTLLAYYMLMGSVLDSSSAATTAAATSESEQQQQLATLALAEAHSMRNGTTAASTSAAPSHGGPTAAATAATATAVEESTDRWSLKNVNRV
eukprot:18252-Heterococcus_DN1.PRE.1